MTRIHPPADKPCASCPYRRDVPSGVWDRSEYEKLPGYDQPTPFQPVGVFLCHLLGRGDRSRVCAGWAGCHDGDHLLALRIAERDGALSADDVTAVIHYVSPVPLFGSGREAAQHGLAEHDRPGPDAVRAARKIRRAQGGHRG